VSLKEADEKNCLQLGSLELNGSVEFLNSVLEALLIQKDLATKAGVQVGQWCMGEEDLLVIRRFAVLREVLHNFAELGHALRLLSGLVVGDSQLNVTEDEVVVEFH